MDEISGLGALVALVVLVVVATLPFLWIAGTVLTALKGKWLVFAFGLAAVPVASGLALVVGFSDGIVFATGLERVGLVALLVLAPLAWGVLLAAAVRLARPGSWWATRRYGPDKLQRASLRFGPP
jgi:hypothetical protein